MFQVYSLNTCTGGQHKAGAYKTLEEAIARARYETRDGMRRFAEAAVMAPNGSILFDTWTTAGSMRTSSTRAMKVGRR